jgi:hypothetical protein
LLPFCAANSPKFMSYRCQHGRRKWRNLFNSFNWRSRKTAMKYFDYFHIVFGIGLTSLVLTLRLFLLQ